MEYDTSEEITESQWDDIESDMRGKIVAACESRRLDETSIDAILNEAKLRFNRHSAPHHSEFEYIKTYLSPSNLSKLKC